MKKYKLIEGVTYNDETFIATLPNDNDTEKEIIEVGEAILLVLIEMHQTISYQELEKQYAHSIKSIKGKAHDKDKKLPVQIKFADALKGLMDAGIVEEISIEKEDGFTLEQMQKIQKIC